MGRFINQYLKKLYKSIKEKKEINLNINAEENDKETTTLLPKDETVEEKNQDEWLYKDIYNEEEKEEMLHQQKFFSPKVGIVKEEKKVEITDDLQVDEIPSNTQLILKVVEEKKLTTKNIQENLLDENVPSNAFLIQNSIILEEETLIKEETKLKIYNFFHLKVYKGLGIFNN